MSAPSDAAWSARMPVIIGLLGLVLLVGGFGTWAGLTQISGAIIASGRIEVDQNRQVVQHPDGGVVAEIYVQEGDSVTEGQVLLRLDATLLQSTLSINENQLAELMARRGRLEAERDGRRDIEFDPLLMELAAHMPDAANLMAGQENLFRAREETNAAEIDQLEKRRGQITNQIEGIEAQQVALARQLELIEQELRDQQSLFDRGLAQAGRVLGLQREQARLTGSVGDLIAQKAQAGGRITEIDTQILKLGSDRREEAITTLRDLQLRELELREERRAMIEQMSRLEITAPVAGVVYDMSVFALRSVLRPADPVLYIVPQDRALVINARVDAIHVDKLFLGQDVTLRFTALDQRRTPELTGRVTQISADAFQDEATRANYYRAEIVLVEGEKDRLPEGTTLIPGMPVETFIRTEDRTPIAYLLKPFTDYLSKAFRG
ncbi:HlyD family secretion protein [Roseovarius lutimaris]|uniref:Membrane fusion protein (MFP) family protein n=1 Tax=Roseovarius lutimaris TaxID=1005928 RepID=A0A1I5EIB9_9RHOB|nr:HlyD family type I secretion periplasmic adaptor subunit [Roseovarius lutimaris]SFO11066.1 HlyD family secretion protein [Roseovarius lutimaris]